VHCNVGWMHVGPHHYFIWWTRTTRMQMPKQKPTAAALAILLVLFSWPISSRLSQMCNNWTQQEFLQSRCPFCCS